MKNERSEILKAGCVVRNDKREVPLVTNWKKEVWAFPKGHAELGETLEQTALREVKEETGYDVQIVRRLSDVTYTNQQTGELIRVAMFEAKPFSASYRAEAQTRSSWFSVEEARKVLYYHNLHFLLDEL